MESPERQEAGFIQDGSQSPLDLLVINQLGCFQTRVVGGEAETGVQHLVHPGWLEALIPELARAGKSTGVYSVEVCKEKVTISCSFSLAYSTCRPGKITAVQTYPWCPWAPPTGKKIISSAILPLPHIWDYIISILNQQNANISYFVNIFMSSLQGVTMWSLSSRKDDMITLNREVKSKLLMQAD